MILTGEPDASFELTPIGYQFSSAGDAFDRNWVTVRAKARLAGDSWGGTDSCLLASELRSLHCWLAAQADGATNVEAELEFLEPQLAFAAQPESGAVKLRIVMRYELATAAGGETPSVRVLQVSVTREALRDAAASLAGEAGVYPER
jgi:hypothetical protein